MHLIIILWSVFAAWKWGDWRNWTKYHPTILFMPIGNLMYGLLVNDTDFYLWRYQSDFLFSQETADVFYTIIVFPATVLLYLSNYPEEKGARVIHVLKYVAIYCIVEWVGIKVGALKHSHGWTMAWSILFNIVAFTILRIHHEKPIIAYISSILFSLFLLYYFQVPLTDKE
jgi:hypothetical protein